MLEAELFPCVQDTALRAALHHENVSSDMPGHGRGREDDDLVGDILWCCDLSECRARQQSLMSSSLDNITQRATHVASHW